MFLIHIQRVICFHLKILFTLHKLQVCGGNSHLKCSIRCGIISHILLTLFKNHMNIDHTFLADLHSLPGNFYVIDGRFCKILHDFLIAQIMTSVPEIILSRYNNLQRFLFTVCIHCLKSPYMNQHFFIHSSHTPVFILFKTCFYVSIL